MMHKPAPPIIGKKNRPLRQQKPGRTVVVCSIDPAEVGNDEQIFEHNKLLQDQEMLAKSGFLMEWDWDQPTWVPTTGHDPIIKK